jgi:hypothetical protein
VGATESANVAAPQGIGHDIIVPVDTFSVLVLRKAFLLAHEANASEITKQHLLVALNEVDEKIPVPPAPTGGPYIPVPHQDLLLRKTWSRLLRALAGLSA